MMDTDGIAPVYFYSTHENALYFDVSAKALDEDAFKTSPYPCSRHWFQNREEKFLLLNASKQFQLQDLADHQKHQPECQFDIHYYDCHPEISPTGRAVMLCVHKDGKKMVVRCRENGDVYAEEMEPREEISASADKAVFLMTKLQGYNKFMFESTEYRSKFLAFQPATENLSQLVLRHKGGDEPSESAEVILSDV